MAVLGIYLLGLAVCLLAGVAVRGLLEPDGRWVGAATLPVGLCALMAALYPLGAIWPGYVIAPAVLVLVAVVGAAAVWRLRRHHRDTALGAVLRPTRGGLLTLAAAAIAGVIALIPTMKQGFPTTIGVSNNDGWGYASVVEWIKDHSMFDSVQPVIARPLTLPPWSTLDNHFGFGFEHFAAMLANLLARDGYEVVNAAAAVALAAGVGGWVMLAGELNPRLGVVETAVVVAAVATPIVALPFAENYTTQFVSVCLWAAAVAAFIRFTRRPGVGRLIVAALTTGGVVGVYPVLSPWLVLPLAGVAVLAPAQPAWGSTRLRPLAGAETRARVLRAVALLACLLAALMVVTPIQMVRGVENLTRLDTIAAGGMTAFFSSEGYGAFFVGATSAFTLFPQTPLDWSILVGLAVMAVVYVVALLPMRRPTAARAVFLALAGGVLLTTAAVAVRYRFVDELPYQLYKGLISGGGVLAGLIVIGLIAFGDARGRALRLAAVGALIAVWLPVTGHVLQASANGGTGFRAADVEMGRAIRALPPGSVVLAEGAANDGRSFQFRMMAAYFDELAPDVTVIGLGSTSSYLTPGGGPEWRPPIPWTHVLTTGPQPIATDRRAVWSNAVYALASAPPQDVTTYGTAWYPPESDGVAVFAWTSGASELVLSNRAATPMRVRLEMGVVSYARPRTLSVAGPRGTARTALPADRITPVGVDMTLPARSATPVTLDARPGPTTAPPGDGRRLLIRLQDVRVTPR